jgi:hypothetical protein
VLRPRNPSAPSPKPKRNQEDAKNAWAWVWVLFDCSGVRGGNRLRGAGLGLSDGREVVSAVGFAGISGNLRVAVMMRGGGADCGAISRLSAPSPKPETHFEVECSVPETQCSVPETLSENATYTKFRTPSSSADLGVALFAAFCCQKTRLRSFVLSLYPLVTV